MLGNSCNYSKEEEFVGQIRINDLNRDGAKKRFDLNRVICSKCLDLAHNLASIKQKEGSHLPEENQRALP